MSLRIAPGLELPLEGVTQTFALLGRRGSGKTSTAVVMAEEMLKANQVICWIDPIGVAWGLRSGFPVLIAGGSHADIPLAPDGGNFMAEFLVESRVSCILDVSDFMEGEMRRFVGDFAQRFYEKNRIAVHLFVDEADEFAPQAGYDASGAKCLGAMQRVIRRGRARGIGATLISQRSAVLNKSVLTQTECLIAMQTTGPQDIAAIKEWIKYHGTAEECEQILAALPKLQAGEGFFYSPGWLKILKKVKFRKRETFDSSSTPKPGETAKVPKTLAQIDLSVLKGQMAQSIEKAKENDPIALKARIRDLEKAAKEPVGADPATLTIIRDAERRAAKEVYVPLIRDMYSAIDLRDRILQQSAKLLVVDAFDFEDMRKRLKEAETESPPSMPSTLRSNPNVAATVRNPPTPDSPKNGLSGPIRKILHSLAWWESIGVGNPEVGRVAFVAGYKQSGSFNTYLSDMRGQGLIDRDSGTVNLTDAGRQFTGPIGSPPTLAQLQQMILDVVREGPLCKILSVFISEHAAYSVTTERLANICGYRVSGSFNTYLSKLSTLGLIKRNKGTIQATNLLFPQGLS